MYRAWDPRLDREVALKLLRRVESGEGALGSLVIEEGRMLARIRHPNVVTVYGADRIDGRVGLWMEFVDGRTLEAVVRDDGPLGPQEAALIGLDLCRALSAVHRAGLVHRDVKAQNVMREAGGRVVLMDFGTGREDFAVRPAEIAGTPLYLAPEVFDNGQATPRSDIYSLGVLLYHLASGAYPVPGRTLAEIREAHAVGRRAWLRDARPNLPDAFVHAIERALKLNPDHRYESAVAMEASLGRAFGTVGLDGVDGAADARAVATTRTASRGKLRGVLRLLAPVMIAAAVVVLASRSWLGTLLTSQAGRPPGQLGALSIQARPSVTVRKVPISFENIGRPSLDGRFLPFGDEDGNIAALELGSGQVRRLLEPTATQFTQFSAASPDGTFVAYTWWEVGGKGEMRVVDIDGRRPRVVLRSHTDEPPWPLEWTHDGKSILSLLGAQLAFVSVDNGAVRPIKTFDSSIPQHFSVSPDGGSIVYDLPQDPSAVSRDIFIVRSDGTDERRLVEHQANDLNPVWTPDGQHVLFTSDRTGTMDVWSVAVSGGSTQGDPELVHRDIGRLYLLGLTDTGAYYYLLRVGIVEVYAADFSTDGHLGRPIPLARRYAGSNISSAWSPDGHDVAWASRRGLVGWDRGFTTLAIRGFDTNEEREFVPAMNAFLVRSWSPDGRRILVNGEDSRGRRGLFQIDASAGGVKPVVLRDDADLGRGDYMPDGRVLYINRTKGALLARDTSRGTDEVLLDMRAEGIDRFSGSVMGRGYKLSPDGQTLAFSAVISEGGSEAHSLRIKSLGGGPSLEVTRVNAPESIVFQDWMPDGQALLFARPATQPRESSAISLWRVSIHGGDAQPLGLSMPGMRDVSVDPGGHRVTFTAGWPTNEIWVMENFLGELQAGR